MHPTRSAIPAVGCAYARQDRDRFVWGWVGALRDRTFPGVLAIALHAEY
ncbi:MAG: hypothetical protein HEQ35_06945 [Gloeotrichia echinulata IR180]|nr:hypothetical protein [Gloeotrichia echinulata DEX184]